MLIDQAPSGVRASAEPGAADDDAWFAAWRSRELSRLERAGITYLDYTGAALHPESVVREDALRLNGCVLGNPHSATVVVPTAKAGIATAKAVIRSAKGVIPRSMSLARSRASDLLPPSQTSADDVSAARAAILEFLHATPDEYAVVLTPNASGACRLVGEAFPFRAGSTYALSADNHNSVNGIREFACRAGASVVVLPLDHELRLRDPQANLSWPERPSLLAFPAQSNFSGVRHPLALIADARDRGWRVLLDAASFLPTADLRLDQVHPDFVALSIYKIAGYPSGIGALVARHEALAELRRPWFAGGTVRWVSVRERRHRLDDGVERFEDGTLPFLAAGAVAPALAAARGVGRDRLGRHLGRLTCAALDTLDSMRHSSGQPLVTIHGPRDAQDRGAAIAFTLRDRVGETIPYWEVEQAARDGGIAVRGGCFCNPGCAEAAFAFPAGYVARCLDPLGDAFTVPRFAACLGDGPVGAIRVSFGLGSVQADVARLVAFLERYVR